MSNDLRLHGKEYKRWRGRPNKYALLQFLGALDAKLDFFSNQRLVLHRLIVIETPQRKWRPRRQQRLPCWRVGTFVFKVFNTVNGALLPRPGGHRSLRVQHRGANRAMEGSSRTASVSWRYTSLARTHDTSTREGVLISSLLASLHLHVLFLSAQNHVVEIVGLRHVHSLMSLVEYLRSNVRVFKVIVQR
jgi:hypothetical protein